MTSFTKNLHFPAPAGPVTNNLVGLASFASFRLASFLRAAIFSSTDILVFSPASFLASSAKVKMYDATII